ncbi:diaminopimelate epimerase [Streptomyces sp. NPDC057697]|uniref:diaminopimelate epimerase n=1 Tax=Streptomyces sp. NPDC057697 TaxID=3346219 RepID=UPI0036B97D85
MLNTFSFTKGHGAQNDFLVLTDRDNQLQLSPADVVALCHRRTGIGADGLLRAVPTSRTPEAVAMAHGADWFMDYRNADGSLGAMCGNGIRVFARHLVTTQLAAPGRMTIATRAGIRTVHVPTDDSRDIQVEMGRPTLPGPDAITVTAGGSSRPAVHVDVGNPHAVAFVDDLNHPGPLDVAPVVTPADAYPHGVTVEFVHRRGPRHLDLRVYERGVGETSACGTGACAAVTAHILTSAGPRTGVFRVDVPGGTLHVTVHDDGTVLLAGPTRIVATGIRPAHRLTAAGTSTGLFGAGAGAEGGAEECRPRSASLVATRLTSSR